MKRWIVGLYLLSILVPAMLAQTKVKEPELPADYLQWPNVFERTLYLDYKNLFSYKMWVRKFKGEEVVEILIVSQINGITISASHINGGDGRPGASVFYIIAGDGYEKFDENARKRIVLSDKVIQEKFKLNDQIFGRMYSFLRLLDPEVKEFFEKLSESDKP